MARLLSSSRALLFAAELDYNATPAAMMVLFAVYLWRTSIVETLGIRRRCS